MGEGIDCTTPAGTLQLHILAALAEFERGRIQQRVKAGLLERERRVCGSDGLDVGSILSGSRRSWGYRFEKRRDGSALLGLPSSGCWRKNLRNLLSDFLGNPISSISNQRCRKRDDFRA